MKSMKAILSVALVLATSSISVASTPVCNHRVASSGNDLFKNTNPPAKKVAVANGTSRPQPRMQSTSGVQ